jgi:hypothetical protein
MYMLMTNQMRRDHTPLLSALPLPRRLQVPPLAAPVVRVAPNSMVVEKRSSPITVHGSDSEEYPVSDIELNDEILKLLDAPVRTTTAAPVASSSMVVERSRKFPIIVHDSDSEYALSDIELDDDITRLLDETD